MHISIKLNTGEIQLDEFHIVASQTLQLSMLAKSIGNTIENSEQIQRNSTYRRFTGEFELNGNKVESVISEFINDACIGCCINLHTETGISLEKIVDFLAKEPTIKITKDKVKNTKIHYEWGEITIKEDRHYAAFSLKIVYKKHQTQ